MAKKTLFEQSFLLVTGRIVKLAAVYESKEIPVAASMKIEVLIKDETDTDFRPPIHLTHPKYWKLKSLNETRSREMQIQYSGLSIRQVRRFFRELSAKTMEENGMTSNINTHQLLAAFSKFAV